MNKKLQNLVQNKYFYLVMSALVAIAIWIIALNTSNPVVETTMEVSVIYINEYVPAEKNLSRVSELGLTTATVKVSGRQNTINNLLPSELKVYVDFSDVKDIGVTHLKVNKPQCDRVGVKILDYYPKEIDVSYDTKSEMNLDVKTIYSNELLAPGYKFLSVTVEPDSIPISGFASDISDLDYIKVDLSDKIEKGSINSNRTISILGRYINTSGHDVTADFDNEKITVKIEVAKQVPVKFTGNPGKDYYVKSSTISDETVLLQGDSEALSSLSQISIDISGITADLNKSIDLSEYVPSGITVYKDPMRTISVDVEKFVTKELKLSISDIKQLGKSDKNDYVISFSGNASAVENTISITVKGKSSDVDSIGIGSFSPQIDLSKLTVGINKNIKITFSAPKDVTIIGEYTVDVEVSLVEDAVATVSPDISATPGADVTPTTDSSASVPYSTPAAA